MKRVGVTGQNGFVGYHLSQTLRLFPQEFTVVPFDRAWFNDPAALDAFVQSCNVIVHLAALNRHNDPDEIYRINTGLVRALVEALDRTNANVHVLISSSTQEERENIYGASKREGREGLAAWAARTGNPFTGMIIPNVFGPFGHPFYNSVVATFCHQLSRGETPKIEVDGHLKLIYVGELVAAMVEAIHAGTNAPALHVHHTAEAKVSELLATLQHYRAVYQDRGEFPALATSFERQLFNTYRCYMDLATYFPRPFVQHTDARGAFVEIARHGIPGQTSFSTTVPGITRGNHYHTRKIERFAVIKGQATIQLRRVGTPDVLTFHLDGNTPAYVDMPIWYTHNITNVGPDTLYTIFWIDEPYNPEDPDTYFENVVEGN